MPVNIQARSHQYHTDMVLQLLEEFIAQCDDPECDDHHRPDGIIIAFTNQQADAINLDTDRILTFLREKCDFPDAVFEGVPSTLDPDSAVYPFTLTNAIEKEYFVMGFAKTDGE